MQNSGKETQYRINHNNPDFSKTFHALPLHVQKEVLIVEEQILSIDPYPRPGDKLIAELQLSQYKDVYRIRIAEGKYRYIYRVEGNTVYAWYVQLRGQNTYKGRLPKRAVQKKDTRFYRKND